MRIPSWLVLLAALPASVTAAAPKKPPAPGAGKSPPACGIKVLPLVAGNTWTYSNVPSPVPVRDDLSRVAPNPAKKVVITVKNVEAGGKDKDSVITLEEVTTYEVADPKAKQPKSVNQKSTTTITCGKNRVEISPDSFFFAGEPGGMLGLAFDKFERKKAPNLSESDLKLTNQGTIGDQKWRTDISAHWKRDPHKGVEVKLGSGRLEMERSFTPANPEELKLKLGSYHAEHLVLLTTGRVYLDNSIAPEGKPCLYRLPDGTDKDGSPKFKDVADVKCDFFPNLQSELWLAEDIGFIQVRNVYAHQYQLTELNLK